MLLVESLIETINQVTVLLLVVCYGSTTEDKINMSKRLIPPTFFNSSLTLSDISQHEVESIAALLVLQGIRLKQSHN